MSDLRLDPTTGDLDLSTGTPVLVDGEEAIAQRIRIRLRFFLGEWFLDTREGVPYYQKILGKKLRKNIVDQIFKDVILSTPGVASLNALSQSYNGATRELSVSFVAVSDTGIVITATQAFIVGSSS